MGFNQHYHPWNKEKEKQLDIKLPCTFLSVYFLRHFMKGSQIQLSGDMAHILSWLTASEWCVFYSHQRLKYKAELDLQLWLYSG